MRDRHPRVVEVSKPGERYIRAMLGTLAETLTDAAHPRLRHDHQHLAQDLRRHSDGNPAIGHRAGLISFDYARLS